MSLNMTSNNCDTRSNNQPQPQQQQSGEEKTPNYGSTLDRSKSSPSPSASSTVRSGHQSHPHHPHPGLLIDVNTYAKQLESNNAQLPNQVICSSSELDRLQVPTTFYRRDDESICTPRSDALPDFSEITKASFWKHPKIKENWKVFLAALGLLIFGICLITTGIVITLIPDIGIQSYVFFIAGVICFIPGAYHVVFVFNAVRGKQGYEFSQIPLFN